MGYVTPSRKFSYEEFVVSDSYPELANNITLTHAQRDIIKLGVEGILDPLRKKIGKQIIINSGYRSLELNTALDGSHDSDHMKACAVDIVSPGLDDWDLFIAICNGDYPFRQLIWYPNKNFVHVSWNIPGRKYKHQMLKAEYGRFTKV